MLVVRYTNINVSDGLSISTHAKQPSCIKEVWPSKVELYMKDECMVWLTTRGDIQMQPRLKY